MKRVYHPNGNLKAFYDEDYSFEWDDVGSLSVYMTPSITFIYYAGSLLHTKVENTTTTYDDYQRPTLYRNDECLVTFSIGDFVKYWGTMKGQPIEGNSRPNPGDKDYYVNEKITTEYLATISLSELLLKRAESIYKLNSPEI